MIDLEEYDKCDEYLYASLEELEEMEGPGPEIPDPTFNNKEMEDSQDLS